MNPFLKRQYYNFMRNYTGEEPFKGCDIKRIRKAYNLSQRCFASMLDISVKTLQNYEIDRRIIPGTARSLFIFAAEHIGMFKKHYLKKVDNIEPYRDSMNK